MRICEYGAALNVNSKWKGDPGEPLLSKTLFVIPPVRSERVAESTRALVVVEESMMVTSDPDAFTPIGTASITRATASTRRIIWLGVNPDPCTPIGWAGS